MVTALHPESWICYFLESWLAGQCHGWVVGNGRAALLRIGSPAPTTMTFVVEPDARKLHSMASVLLWRLMRLKVGGWAGIGAMAGAKLGNDSGMEHMTESLEKSLCNAMPVEHRGHRLNRQREVRQEML